MLGPANLIKNALGFQDESWATRTAAFITLISPSGTEFTAAWQQNTKSRGKRVATHKVPFLDGEIAKDYGADSDRYPSLKIIFSGKDHDLVSQAFENRLNERGLWTVIHPVEGMKELQYISSEKTINAIEDAGCTVFDISWMKPIEESWVLGIPGLFNDVSSAFGALGDGAYTQFGKAGSFAKFAKVAKANQSFKAAFQGLKKLGSMMLKDTPEAIRARTEAELNFMQATNPSATDIGLVATSMANYISAFQAVGSSAIDRFKTMYDVSAMALALVDAFSSTIDASPAFLVEDLMNEYAVNEYISTIVLGNLMISAVSLDPSQTLSSRSEVADVINGLHDKFFDTVNRLETAWEKIGSNTSQLPLQDSFDNLRYMFGSVVSFLQKASLDLKVEKIITLTKGEAVPNIVLSAYGTLGDNGEMYDMFIQHNALSGKDVLFLPEGRKVKVYYGLKG